MRKKKKNRSTKIQYKIKPELSMSLVDESGKINNIEETLKELGNVSIDTKDVLSFAVAMFLYDLFKKFVKL